MYRRVSLRTALIFSLAALFTGVASSGAAESTGVLTVERQVSIAELEQMGFRLARPNAPNAPEVVDPNAIYSNITTFSGQAFAQGPSVLQTTNQITRMVMDDVTFTTAPGVSNVTTLRFSVANLNAVAVSARPRVRFWRADGAALGGGLPNGPGNYYDPGTGDVGFTFNAISFPAGVVTTINGNLGAGFAVPAGATTTLWVGITFDNNSGATGATAAQMDNLGQGMFVPVDLGSSTDTVFETTAAGSFLSTDNPAGAAVNFSGTPIANMGWEFVVTTLPVELLSVEVE